MGMTIKITLSAHRRLRMTRPLLRKHSAPTWNITTIPATALCLLLFPLGTGAFSVPAPYNSLQYRLVDHVDQLQQLQRSRTASHDSSVGSSSNSDPTTTPAAVKVVVPPPHLFRIPAPGGDVCLVVDEKGAYHAVRDAFPPLGLPVSSTGVVDTQVGLYTEYLYQVPERALLRIYKHQPCVPSVPKSVLHRQHDAPNTKHTSVPVHV